MAALVREGQPQCSEGVGQLMGMRVYNGHRGCPATGWNSRGRGSSGKGSLGAGAGAGVAEGSGHGASGRRVMCGGWEHASCPAGKSRKPGLNVQVGGAGDLCVRGVAAAEGAGPRPWKDFGFCAVRDQSCEQGLL